MDTVKYYIAGIIDGEGTITIKRQKNKLAKRGISFIPFISCGQTIKGKKVIYLLKKYFGGSIYSWKQKNNRLDTISWSIVGRDVEKCVKKLYPLLLLKKKQAKVVLDYYKYFKNIKHGSHLTDKQFYKKQDFFYKMRKLNVKGKLRLQRLSEETSKEDTTV